MTLQWENFLGDEAVWRGKLDGRTVAAVLLDGPAAVVIAADIHGHETRAEIIGDTLDENKQTALDMLRAAGWQI